MGIISKTGLFSNRFLIIFGTIHSDQVDRITFFLSDVASTAPNVSERSAT